MLEVSKRCRLRVSRNYPPRMKKHGFTLIEVVVAIVLLTVGALALAGSAAVTIRRMSAAQRNSSAASAARTRAETLLSQDNGS